MAETAIFSYNLILREHYCSSKCPGPAVANFQLMINSHMINKVKNQFSVSSPPQCWSKAVVYVSTPMMYPLSRYFLQKFFE